MPFPNHSRLQRLRAFIHSRYIGLASKIIRIAKFAVAGDEGLIATRHHIVWHWQHQRKLLIAKFLYLHFPHAIGVTTANVTDQNSALKLFETHKDNLSHVVNALADGGYSGEKFAEAAKEILGCTVEIAKRNELHTFAVIPQRWVVKRSFAWL